MTTVRIRSLRPSRAIDRVVAGLLPGDYLIPPAVDPACEPELGVVNQMDLRRSGDIFCWVIPEALKFALLDMRLQYRH